VIALAGTTAENTKHTDYRKLVFLFVVKVDEPTAGESPRCYATREITLSAQVYTDLIANFSFEWTELNLKGGLSTVASLRLSLRNENKVSQLADDFILSYDEVEAYLLISDGTEDNTDRIPIGRGAITDHPHDIEEFTIDVIDVSDKDWDGIPRRKILPGPGNSFEFAPREHWNKPLPFYFGNYNIGPYDGTGVDRLVVKAYCVDKFQQKYTTGLYNKVNSTPFQRYVQADNHLAEILNFTQTGAYFTVNDPTRKLLLRPVRKDGANTVTAWRNTADGDDSTSVTVLATDTLSIYFAGVPKLGDLTAATVEIKATGNYSYSIEHSAFGAPITGSDTNDASISLASELSVWAEDWDYQILKCELTFSTTPTIKRIELDVRFNDLNQIESKSLDVFQKIQGVQDKATYYVDGTVINADGVVHTNPVHILETIFRHKDLLAKSINDLDTASFTTAAAARSDWSFFFPILEILEEIEDLQPFLEEAGLHLYQNTAGKWRVVARDKAADPQHIFLEQWNLCVEDAEVDYNDYLTDIDFSRVENRDLENEFVVHAQRDLSSDEYNVLEIASSAYRITGTCSVNATTGQLNASGQTFEDDEVETGWVAYVDTDQAYTVNGAPVDQDTLNLTAAPGSQITEIAAGTTFWLGPFLDADALRSRRKHKSLRPWGRKQSGLDIGGKESHYIFDRATAQKVIDFRTEWFGQLLPILTVYLPPGHMEIEPGDIAILDQAWLPEKKRPLKLTTLDGAITSTSALTFKVADGTAEAIRDDDILLLRDDKRKPEIMGKVIDSDLVTDIITVASRGWANTQGQTHVDLANVERITTKYEVLAVRYPSLDDMRIGVKLLEVPTWYFPILIIAPDSIPENWTDWTALEQEFYRAITWESGLIEDRNPQSTQVIAPG